MDNILDTSVSQEMLAAALAISEAVNKHKIYFNKETGEILSVTNENSKEFTDYIEMLSDEVADFLNGSKDINHFKLIFISETNTPVFVKKFEAVDSILLSEVPDVANTDTGFLIENYPDIKMWSFRLSPTEKTSFKNFSLSTKLEIYIVDVDNSNFLYRTISVPFEELLTEDRVMIEHIFPIEQKTKRIKVLTNKFFMNFGYKVLYDTED